MPVATDLDGEAHVRAVARQLDYDRYLAALLAPRGAREGLMILAAFHGEIARVPASVREPTMGAIRLQWWREVLEAPPAEATGSPVADSVIRLIAAGRLRRDEMASIIDAYEELLRPGSLASRAHIDSFTDASQGAAFLLAGGILDRGAGDDASRLITAAARCYGRVQLLRALPILLDKGHNNLATGSVCDWGPIVQPIVADARSYLAEVRRSVPLASATLRHAILPVALVEPYLRVLQGLGPRIAFEQAQISPLSRVWRIYIAKRLQRF